MLSEGPSHGYDLAAALEEPLGDGRVDFGSLYRILRSLEAEGVVRSAWRGDLPGPLKGAYELTDDGSAPLRAWAGALSASRERIDCLPPALRGRGARREQRHDVRQRGAGMRTIEQETDVWGLRRRGRCGCGGPGCCGGGRASDPRFGDEESVVADREALEERRPDLEEELAALSEQLRRAG